MAAILLLSIGGEALYAINNASNESSVLSLNQSSDLIDFNGDLSQDYPKTISYNTQKYHWNNHFLNTFTSNHRYSLSKSFQTQPEKRIIGCIDHLCTEKKCIGLYYVAPNAP
ncbi:hypothetical protein NH26_18570 [Flammeovirga pacifica]|uniref:Uncharacterized protein n=2 Tax=Flammeovirga pacifica TaxID=915059 RepID=A0A1S1Z4J3_FLAPC|nr:hypothetical protein NH26_18570 [Flammeovirga pacifica]